MPRAKKSDKFFIYAPGKTGHYKGKRLLGINNAEDAVTVQDLLDFLKEKEVDPSKVKLPKPFITVAEK